MAQPVRRQCESQTYHVVSRGAGRQIIFEDDADKQAFYNLLVKVAERSQVKMLAWCLMDNHVHLLFQAELGEISKAMQKILSVYALGFNERHGRTGHVFESRFKSEPVEGDAHFLSAVRYIHQNPAKANLASTEAYRWSSYGEYAGKRAAKVCDTSLALEMLGSKAAFVKFHKAGDAVGEDCFLDEGDGRGEAAAKRALRIALDELGDKGLNEVKSLPKAERKAAVRRLGACGLTSRQIGRFTGLSHATVANILKQDFTDIL